MIKNKSLIIGLTTLSLLSIAGYSLFYYSRTTAQKAQPISIAAINAATGNIIMTITPATSVFNKVGDEATFSVNADTTTGNMTGVDLELNYDPTQLELSALAKGPFLGTLVTAPTISGGKAKVAIGASYLTGAKTGTGVVATFKAKALKPGISNITIDGNTIATSTTVGDSLKSVAPSQVTTYGRADLYGPSGTPDGHVDAYDYTPIATDYGKTGAPGFIRSDMNGASNGPDGSVNMHDYSFFVSEYGKVYY